MSALEVNAGNGTPQDLTGIAISMGGLLEQSKYVIKTVDEIKGTVGGVVITQAEHGLLLQKTIGRVDAHDGILAAQAPVKTSWPIVVSVIIAGGSFAFAVAQFYFTHLPVTP